MDTGGLGLCVYKLLDRARAFLFSLFSLERAALWLEGAVNGAPALEVRRAPRCPRPGDVQLGSLANDPSIPLPHPAPPWPAPVRITSSPVEAKVQDSMCRRSLVTRNGPPSARRRI